MVDIAEAVKKVRKFYIYTKRAPSYSELQALFGYKSKNAAVYLADKLITEGVLDKDDKGHLVPKRLFLPSRLYGSIRAGFPSPAEDQVTDIISLDQYLVNNPDGAFLLKVSGDSMIDAGIQDGDIVIVEKHRTPKSGDIVVAYVDGGWTLKYYVKGDNETPQFVPANKKYNIITPQYEAVIGGVVVSQVRKYY